MRIAPRAFRFISLCLIAAGMLLGCDSATAPTSRVEIYELASVAGMTVGPQTNLSTVCQPVYATMGAAIWIDSDSLVLGPNGTGFSIEHQRSRGADSDYGGGPVFITHTDWRHPILWEREGRKLRVTRPGGPISIMTVLEGGALERDGFCGTWHYEKASP